MNYSGRHPCTFSAVPVSVGWAILLLVASSAPLPAQLFLNLSFETSSNGIPTGWYLSSSAYQYAVDTSTAVDGVQSLQIASLTSDTAQFGYASESLTAGPAIGKTFHLSGFIRTQGVNGYAGLWANTADSQGNALAFQNLGSLAPAGTTGWQSYSLSLRVPAGAVSVNFGVLLSGAGTAWFDNLSIDVNGQPYFSSPTAAQIQWLQANAFPFTSLDPNADFTELEPLENIIGNAHIVGLGEGTHGTSEFFRMKARLVSFLVEEMGFTIFAIEANMPEAYRMNDYVLTGRGDPTELLKGMYFWTWNTQEVLDMVMWMRQYNASGKGTIQFLGFDMQSPSVAMDYVVRFVRQADPGLLSAVNSSYNLLIPLSFSAGATASSRAQYQAAQAAAQSVLDRLQANRGKYLQQMSATEVDWAIQNARIVEQAVQFATTGDDTFRDASMAANIEWIAAQAPPGARIVLWAHDGHINKEPAAMGGALAKYFGQDFVTFGQAFHSGTYRAVDPDDVLGVYLALDSFPGSAEYYFHETGTPQQILPLGLANANDPGSSWLLGGLEFRSIGALEEDGIAEFSGTSSLVQDFDGLIFFDQTTASAELPYYGMDMAVFAPVAAPEGALGVPYVAASAPGKGTPSPLPAGTVDVPYAQTLMGGGAPCSWGGCGTLDWWPAYTNWTVIAGALPPGLSLSPDGVLSGTPTKTGLFTLTVQTTNNISQQTALGQLQLRIGPLGQASPSPCPLAGATGSFAIPRVDCGPPQPPRPI